jgi:hypothetical protein
MLFPRLFPEKDINFLFCLEDSYAFTAHSENIAVYVQARAINFGRQGHSLTQSKMLHCKTVVNIITYHHIV